MSKKSWKKKRAAKRAAMAPKGSPEAVPGVLNQELRDKTGTLPSLADLNHTRNWAVVFLLVAATFVTYYGVLHHPFVSYDDTDYVTSNDQVQRGISLKGIQWAVTSMSHANWHPVTWWSHMLDCEIFGLNPAGHHLTNLLLHVLNAVLLYLFFFWITRSEGRSLMVAALFALHPFNVESVAWVAERKNVLSMFFFLISLFTYAWYSLKPSLERYLAIVVSFGLALAAKPQVVTLPFLLLLLDYWPLQRIANWQSPSTTFPARQRGPGYLAAEKVPLLLMSLADIILTVKAQRTALYGMERLPFFPRITNAIFAYFEYLFKAVWPLRLAVFYPHWARLISWWQVLFSLAFLIGVSVWVWRNRKVGYLAVGWLWFIGTLVPMIGIVQVGMQGMADRYAYLPLIGIFLLAVWGLADLAQQRGIGARTVALACGAVLLIFSVLTIRQVATWKSSANLWTHALKVTDDNYLAEDYIGTAILEDVYHRTGQRYSDEAVAHFKTSLRMNPEDTMALLNVGADFQERGDAQDAIPLYEAALRTTQSPDMIEKAYLNLADSQAEVGNLETARGYYHRILAMDPGNSFAFNGLGRVRMRQRAEELAKQAEGHPTAQIYMQIGKLQRDAGQSASAKQAFEHALKLDPKLADAQAALASMD
jgi:protein O-mannosyl-transferase